MKAKIIYFFKENKFPLILFLFSTIFFILQHILYLSWDYSVYELNAKYLFSNGNYFEILRPPLTPVLIGILSLFNFYSFGKYAYLVFVSFLYFIACVKIADKIKINKNMFYVLCLNPYVLQKGLSVGTELLTLSLLMFFVLSYFNNKNGGIFLGLATITRYPLALFSVLILFYKKFKKIALNAFLFSIPILIWLAYNYFATGDPFTSIADSYALNFLSRKNILQPFNIWHILFVANVMILFLAVYAYRLANPKFRRNEFKDLNNVLMILIAVLTIYTYASTPFKDVRYLFNLTLPLVYFSCKAVKKPNKYFIFILGAAFLIFSYCDLIITYPDASIAKSAFEKDIREINKLNIKNCSIRSDVWPLMAYYGYSANFNKEDLTEKYVQNGEYLVLFPNYGEYKYKNLNSDLIIMQTDRFIVLGNKSISCKPASRIYNSYLKGFNESVYLKHGYYVNIDPYYVLFTKNEDFS